VDRLPDGHLELAAGVEAELELEERVAPAANPAAEVEALVGESLRPAGRLEEEEVARAELATGLAGGAEVVVEPGGRVEAEQRRILACLEEHDVVAQLGLERSPVGGREVVKALCTLPLHRLLVEVGEALEALREERRRRLDAGRYGLAHDAAVVAVHPFEEVVALVETPPDCRTELLDAHVRPGVAMVRVERVEADEGGDDPVGAAPLVVGLPEPRAHGAAVAVRGDHVGRALTEDGCENGVLGAQEQRPPGLEQRRGLDVLAGQVHVAEAELLEQPVPVLSRDLSDQQ
jgi:hypothetical protein